jgi:hypothetical protein
MQSDPMDTSKILLEAIALKKCVEATYNRMVVKLAPHILYTRHGELYVDAVTVERDGKPPREIKLGTFKLSGLNSPGLVSRTFNAEPVFNPADDKYAGVTLFAVETN